MSLQIWLPLNKGKIENKGLANVDIKPYYFSDFHSGGRFGGWYEPSADDGYISVPLPTLQTTNQWTISFYIDCENAGDILTCGLLYFFGGSDYYAHLYINGHDYAPSSLVTLGFITCTYNGSQLKIYQDGQLLTTISISNLIISNKTLFIGSDTDYTSLKQLNDVRVYDECLSDTQVQAIQDALIVHYPLSHEGMGRENLFRGSAFDPTEIGTLVTTDINACTSGKIVTYYNGNASNHSFADGIDTITVNSTSNIGLAFIRKASDIALQAGYDYTISCEAQSPQTAKPLCIGLSYYTNANTWIWRGGTNPQNFTTANSWQKFSFTFRPDADTQYIAYCFTVAGNSSGSFTYKIRNCKLEKGGRATNWVPNQMDLVARNVMLTPTKIFDMSGFDNHGSHMLNKLYNGGGNPYTCSANFNANNQHFRMINPPDLKGTSELTLAAWIYQTGRGASDYSCILIYHGQYLTISQAGKLAGYAYGMTPPGYHESTSTIPLNTWTHVAITWNGSNIKFYINGQLDRTVSSSGDFSLTYASQPHGCIGAEFRTNVLYTRQFLGNIQDVRVYASCLDAGSIQRLYSNTVYKNNYNNITEVNCTHTNAVTKKLSYCIGEHEWDCCTSEGEYQNWKICPDCGYVYVSATGASGESMSCEVCDTLIDWRSYRDKWLPPDTFRNLTDYAEYTNVVH